jgi:hypothetical protein
MLDLQTLLDRIVEYNDLPKFQVERALSPVLSFFVAAIVDIALETSGTELISPEFPLKKENNQSTNIDYLVADPAKGRVVLVEFKTDFRASANEVLGHQKNYQHIVDRIRNETCAFLSADLMRITSRSGKKDKYRYLREQASRLDTGITDAHILYVVPERTAKKLSGENLRDTTILPFSRLPENISHDPAFRIVRNALLQL